MDMDKFLLAQKNKLQVDKDRLKFKTTCNNGRPQKNLNCTGKIERPVINCNDTLDQRKQCSKNSIMDFQPQVIDPPTDTTAGVRQLISTTSCTESSIATSSPRHGELNEQHADIENNVFLIYDNLSRKYCELSNGRSVTKTAKDLANLTERQFQGVDDVDAKNLKLHKSKDDMEQWVTDTFYSYFPGFNNENKKRQDILHDRQLEYEQNFIKHQMIEAAANSGKKKHQHDPLDGKDENTLDPNLKPLTSRSDKTDLEIIVNNPDYEAKSPRPGSARHKLLQDLRHTEISNIVNNDGVTERNRRIAEAEMAKKKDYQKDLMAQIEEKRRSIEILKEKERRQEEALTRKLQEQLKTMRLQEELEKEKMRADKIRFDSEQNRLMRKHLLTKLENDSKLLCSSRKPRSENDKVTPSENKVYKYFSNSARHEYRRGVHTEPPAFHLELPQPSSQVNECFHNDDTCLFCNSVLKSYESWCLKCEKRIFETVDSDLQHLVCDNCKKQYSVCAKCDKTDQSECTYCQRKRSICANCRRAMCSDCIEAKASEKDQLKPDMERSFEILEVNYPEEIEYDSSPNNLNESSESNRPPFSMNIDRNSIFHHSFNRSKLLDDENNIDAIRYETDKRLSRYLKNYGDIASKALRDRSTQTTPDSASRRDIVMVEENNLSMPLLREMPRMTRKESNMQQQERKTKGTRIENLARRWEVPAVQKHTITTNSPKVLTQLGAIRKQLQSEQFHLDY